MMGHKHKTSHSTEQNHTVPNIKVDFSNDVWNETRKETKSKIKRKNSMINQGLNKYELSDDESEKNTQVSSDKIKDNIDPQDNPSEVTVISKKKKKKKKTKISPSEANDNKVHEETPKEKSKKARIDKVCENSIKIQLVTETQSCKELMCQASECEKKKHKKKKNKKRQDISDRESDAERTSCSDKAGSSAFDIIVHNKTVDKMRNHDEGSEIDLKDTLARRAQENCEKSEKSYEISLNQSVNNTRSLKGEDSEEAANCVKKHKKHRKKTSSERFSTADDEPIIESSKCIENRKKFKEYCQESVHIFPNGVADDLDRFDKDEPSKKRKKYENNGEVQSISVVDDKICSKKKKVKVTDSLKYDEIGSAGVSDVFRTTTEKLMGLKNEPTANEANLHPSKSTANVPNLGQWKNASIEGEERKLKFFRLLGGFKETGSSASINNGHGIQMENSHGSKFSSMAMHKGEINKLNAALEGQFEKARNLMFNQQRGVGLGFTQAPDVGKKFHIDTLITKSKKFND